MIHRVVVVGACGRMGREVVRAVLHEDDMALVGAVDVSGVGQDIGMIVGTGPLGVIVSDDLKHTLSSSRATHGVDFTAPSAVKANALTMLECGVHPVIGTTGLSAQDIDDLRRAASRESVGVLVAPNFAIGAVLMMRFARMAANLFESVEIIELHHDQKLDAPSGTAIKTAEMIAAERSSGFTRRPDEVETLKGARGGVLHGIRIHSVRLPGLIAHQEVIFGNEGQTLTIRHDSLSRTSFMPGVMIGIRRIVGRTDLVYGLDELLDL